jgi:hypothetical protein
MAWKSALKINAQLLVRRGSAKCTLHVLSEKAGATPIVGIAIECWTDVTCGAFKKPRPQKGF